MLRAVVWGGSCCEGGRGPETPSRRWRRGKTLRAKDAGGQYEVDLTFDVVGYSMPLTMALQTAACLGALPSSSVRVFVCLACGGVGWFLLRRRPGSGDSIAKMA